MVRGKIPWTGQGRPGNGGEIFERGSKLVHKSLWFGVLVRSDQPQSLTKRCAFVWRSRICLCTFVLRTGRSLHLRFCVIFGVFGIWGYPHEGQLFPWCPPLGRRRAAATAAARRQRPRAGAGYSRADAGNRVVRARRHRRWASSRSPPAAGSKPSFSNTPGGGRGVLVAGAPALDAGWTHRDGV